MEKSTQINVTDKELLTFCNLTNLKMEYANLIEKYESKEIIDEQTKRKTTIQIPVNHTIYSLLENEVESKLNSID